MTTNAGAHIDMALLDTRVGVLANQALNWMASGKGAAPEWATYADLNCPIRRRSGAGRRADHRGGQ